MTTPQIEMLHVLAHDIRNPLATFLQGLELLSEPKIGPLNAQQAQIVQSLLKQAKTLNVILNEVLELQQLTTGKIKLQKVPALFAHVLEVTTEEMQEQAQFAHVQLQLHHALAAQSTLPIDVFRIRQVLRNLLSNAIRFAPPNTAVKIEAQQGQNFIQVSVQNDGRALSQKELQNIFEPFSKNELPQKLGHGLGLSICQNIIELHGGKIWAENVQPQGVRFTFTLPIE